jgi:glycolate dehydrogenase iron-sulfur subunit
VNLFVGLDSCTHCGFCLPACPTYVATRNELASPRGRIVLLRALADGELTAGDPALLRHLESCTMCHACEPACPSGVAFADAYRAAQTLLAGAGVQLVPSPGNAPA